MFLYRKVCRSGCDGSRYLSRSNSYLRVKSDLYQIVSWRVIPVRCDSMSRNVPVLYDLLHVRVEALELLVDDRVACGGEAGEDDPEREQGRKQATAGVPD